MSEGPRILVIDDDATFRERLSRALSDRGCRVCSAGVAEEAIQAWEAEAFEGAVLDLRLVSASGLDFIGRFRERRPSARIVILTGFGSLATAMEAGRRGAAEYLTKPVDPDRLVQALLGPPGFARSPEAAGPTVLSLERVEWEHMQRVLTECRGNISRTARLLGIDRRSLQRKLAKYPPRQ
jgi:two-component system response regulator RegA